MSILFAYITASTTGTTANTRFRLETGDTVVAALGAMDRRGDVEIRWDHGISDGITACLTVREARVLREQLTVVLDEFSGIDNDVEGQGSVNDDRPSSLPEWVRQTLSGPPARTDDAVSRENRSGTTGPKGVA